jgi:hypothetical protein
MRTGLEVKVMGQETGDRGQGQETGDRRQETGDRRQETEKPWLFHTMENFFPDFPRYGKFLGAFSTPWKTFAWFFHAMEKFCGEFSTPWKTFFHGVENPEKRGWRSAC